MTTIVPVSDSISPNPYFMLSEDHQLAIDLRVHIAIDAAAKEITSEIATEEGLKPDSTEYKHLSKLINQQIRAYVSIKTVAGAKR